MTEYIEVHETSTTYVETRADLMSAVADGFDEIELSTTDDDLSSIMFSALLASESPFGAMYPGWLVKSRTPGDPDMRLPAIFVIVKTS
jgi:hypothetical protein